MTNPFKIKCLVCGDIIEEHGYTKDGSVNSPLHPIACLAKLHEYLNAYVKVDNMLHNSRMNLKD